MESPEQYEAKVDAYYSGYVHEELARPAIVEANYEQQYHNEYLYAAPTAAAA